MPPVYFVALFLTASALAQTNCPDRTCREITPITGIVTSATDGRPIAGAIVHYRGTANTSDEKGIVINPTSLQGQVITAADGRYSLPQLPFGDFIVRVSANGFFAGRKEIQPRLAGDRPQPPVPVPAFLCRGSGRSYPCGVLPPVPSGDFKLQPDPLHLTAI